MARFLRRLQRMRRLARARHALGSLSWARLLENYNINVQTWPCELRDGGLFFSSLGTVIPGPGPNILLSGFDRAVRLHRGGVAFDTKADFLQAKIGKVSVRVDNIEELQILEEIYLNGIYHFQLAGPLLIVDIGMNAAYAALYFAATHPDAVVCAYELSSLTCGLAEANIALNPEFQSRIRAHQFGLSDCDRMVDIEYIDRYRGSVGLYGIPKVLSPGGEVKFERCELRDAAGELGKLYDEFQDRRVVLKVDCEGSEYAVLARLAEKGMFDRIDLMMIECHRRAANHDPVALRAFLVSHGFGCLHLSADLPESMLYAFKATKSSRIRPDRDIEFKASSAVA